ncbi:TPA: replicative DNA helicase [Clostridium botulinum]|nr:replicative DNA helicase [Clostridium botulinum]HDK7158739.1 replicative DNA helicase [Clostridium botulinum]
MGISIGNITENYGERIQRLALFDTLYKLKSKKLKDNSDNIIDGFSLGLISLLFFFENMLIRNKKTGVKELASFLQELNKGEIDLNYEGFEKIARIIIETFRPPTGKRNSKEFYNWETRKRESVQYSILKADKADLKTNTQYYTLDEQGLELIFATKEYFNEFQLSINQLVLRKQLEKGEFVGALRQIDEMSLDVKNLQDRMMRIKHEVNRNIVSTETYERYKNIIEDINIRLQRENEEFDELQSFVKETKEKVGNEITNDKDKKAYELIIKIDKELGQVHYDHRLLLKESIILKTSALQAAQEALYYVGIDSFNFDQEITSRIFSSPLPLDSSRILIEPFMYLEKYEIWSPLTVFAKQRIENKDKQEKTQDFLSLSEEEERELDLKIKRENFKIIAEILLEAMKDNVNEITLCEVVKYMKENKYMHILDYRVFYDFWIILHQKSPIVIDIKEETEESLFGEAFNLLINKGNIIYIEEIEGILKVTDRFTIKNMSFRLEDKYASVQ